MADEAVHKQEFILRNLPTQSVTLYPTGAQIVRKINDVSLKPGQNKIIIVGLTPTADPNSVKVEGTGTAVITDLSVQLVNNKEQYEDIYPSDDQDESDGIESSDTESEGDELKTLKKEIDGAESALHSERERIESALKRQSLLDTYCSSDNHYADSVVNLLSDYQAERAKIYEETRASEVHLCELEQKHRQLEKKRQRLQRAAEKAKKKANKLKIKQINKKRRQKMEIEEEKALIRAERANFWPQKVLQVAISLDASVGFTPASSRRGSVDSLVKEASSFPKTAISCDVSEVNLILSYITYSASWSPRYDLSLNTVSKTGTLDYSAELTNTTSEIWRDVKVTLSTSQTSFQGLGEDIPEMHPWHVRLSKRHHANVVGPNGGSALYSSEEWSEQNRQAFRAKQDASHLRRHELFGLPYTGEPLRELATYNETTGGVPKPAPPAPMALNPYQTRVTTLQKQNSNKRSMVPGASVQASAWGGFASQASGALMASAPAAPASGPVGAFGSATGTTLFGTTTRPEAAMDNLPATVGGYYDDETFAASSAAIEFEQSSVEESGFTTTYDLPSLKTIAPSSSSTRHKIARVEFKSATFSHIVIPKLKASAFLKARLHNTSSLTLLKGPMGLTLDGSYLGQSRIPRCSAGDSFTLSLGVDPSITVSYSKPTVRRSQSGIFSKEDCEVHTRCATITNTKRNVAVELTVLDQVPVSEDERLRIEIVSPKGLRIGGDAVATGSGTGPDPKDGDKDQSETGNVRNARLSVSGDKKWGRASVVAKKTGEVNWKVNVNPGKGCKLLLEYEATYPGGEMIVNA